MTDETNHQRNALLKQVHDMQAREFKVRKFLRELDKDETLDLKGAHNMFTNLMEEFLPNG
tara:strand:+ start:294 stop:473 length:180 start_codon:yes stop_codon:yes gene_type:complete